MCEFSVVPLGAGESLSSCVAECVNIVKESGLSYQLTPMGTILEGEWDEVMGTIRKCRDVLRAHFNRVLITIRIDDRQAPPGRLQAKVRSVEEKLGRM